MKKKKKIIRSRFFPAWVSRIFKKLNNFQIILTAIFIFLSTAFVIAGYIYYKAQVEEVQSLTNKHLKFSSAAKSSQIKSWLGERRNDAEILFNSTLIARQTHKFISDTSSKSEKEILLEVLQSLYKTDQYDSFRITDLIGNVIFSSNEDYEKLSPASRKFFNKSIESGKNVFSGFTNGTQDKKFYMKFFIPIFLREANKSRPIAVFILKIDPDKYFYPLVQSDLEIDSDLEFVLVRNDGDSFVYLNKMDIADSSVFGLKIKANETHKHLILAKEGNENVISSVDYKGNNVLTTVKNISDSPWTLITKIDSTKVYENINSAAGNIALVVFLFIAMSGFSIGFIGTKSSEIHFKKLYKSEKERRARAHQYVALLKNANDSILLFKENGSIYEINERACSLYGYTSEEFRKMNIRELVSHAAETGLARRIEKILESDGAVYETTHKKRDGTSFPVEVSARAIKIDGIEYFQAIVRDISDRMEADKKIKAQNDFLQLTINSLTHPFLVIDANDYTIKLANDAARAMGPKEALTCYTLTHPANESCNNRPEQCPLSIIRNSLQPAKVEHIINDPNGDARYFELNAYPIFDSAGMLAEIIEYYVDITDRKKQELDLIKARDDAEEANRLKSIFLANMSHELRTPLNGILGFSEIIAEDAEQESIKNLAQMLNLSAIRLFKTLNLILDLSIIEAGKLELQYELMSANTIIQEVFDLYRTEGTKKGLEMKLSLDAEEILFKTDARIFTSIIDNLLHNAIKFTQKGFVKLIIRINAETDDLVIKVEDSGIGIKEQYLERIWEQFKQVSEGLNRSFEGSGLGLSLVNKYVKKLNGRTEVESVYGSGTTFTVYLPRNL